MSAPADRIDELRKIAGPASRAVMLARRAKEQAEALGATMQAIHGGKFQVCVDHDSAFVFVNRER